MEKEKFLSFFPPKKKNILNANLIVYPREKDKPKIHERQLKLQCMSINMIICQMNDKKKILLGFQKRKSSLTITMVKRTVQFSSVAQSCLTLCDPKSRSPPGLHVHHQLPEFTQTHAIESVMPSSHLILGCPLLLLPPTPPSIRVFSSESALRIRWPKY